MFVQNESCPNNLISFKDIKMLKHIIVACLLVIRQDIKQLQTQEQLVDFFFKPLRTVTFTTHFKLLNMLALGEDLE